VTATPTISLIDPQLDEQWNAYVACRVRNLYTPYGLPASCADSDLDRPRSRPDILHRAATLDGRVVGVGRLDLQPERAKGPSAQLRFFAVDADTRGTGVGRALLAELERLARDYRVRYLWMEARQEALGFYERCGYSDIGLGPTKWGVIPHRLLEKDLG
jgi:GNAT superfamily N-acetyltransferase